VLEAEGSVGESVFMAAKSTGTLVLDNSALFTGRVYGLSMVNHIDLKNVTFTGSDTTSYAGSAEGGTLSILDGSAVVATIKLSGNYLSSKFILSTDTTGGTLITDPTSASKLTSAMASLAGPAAASGRNSAQAAAATPILARPGG
jgi:hypothetical protein